MPGREDFAIIRARLLADPRAHQAALAYVQAGLAVHTTALSTVIGHVAMLGLHASRETDDGVIAESAVAVATMSFGCPPDVPRTIGLCLIDAGLLRAEPNSSLYVVGFGDCYAPILAKRERDKARKADARALASAGRPADVRAVSRRTVPYRTDPDRTGGTPLTPLEGGSSTDVGKQIRPREREHFDNVLEFLVRCGRSDLERTAAAELRREHLRKPLKDPDIHLWLSGKFKWVTKERIRRWKANG